MPINSKWVKVQLNITTKVKCFVENLMFSFPYYVRVLNKVFDKSMPGAPTLCNIFIYLYFIYLYIQYHTSDLTITTPVAESDSIVKGGERVGWGVVEGGGGGGGAKKQKNIGGGGG